MGNPSECGIPVRRHNVPHRTHTIAQKPMGAHGARVEKPWPGAPRKTRRAGAARPLMKGNQYGYHTCRQILSEERIDCDGILNVTLSVTAQPDVVNIPWISRLFWTVPAA